MCVFLSEHCAVKKMDRKRDYSMTQYNVDLYVIFDHIVKSVKKKLLAAIVNMSIYNYLTNCELMLSILLPLFSEQRAASHTHTELTLIKVFSYLFIIIDLFFFVYKNCELLTL